jgi:hypothetical protein
MLFYVQISKVLKLYTPDVHAQQYYLPVQCQPSTSYASVKTAETHHSLFSLSL